MVADRGYASEPTFAGTLGCALEKEVTAACWDLAARMRNVSRAQMPEPRVLHCHWAEGVQQDSSGTIRAKAEGDQEGGPHMKTIITGGTVVNSEGEYQADVLVDGGRIVAVGLDLPRDGAEVVDASHAYVIPGGIDVPVSYTHLTLPT